MLQSLSEFLSSVETLLNHLEYEKNSQLFFREGLKKYTGAGNFEVEFRDFVENKIRPSIVSSKTYSYRNAIVSLYGFLERFIEDIIVEYLRDICQRCSDYGALPLSIRKNHLISSLELVNKIQRIRGLTVEQRSEKLKVAVRNMHNCLEGEKCYSLNLDAFSGHTSNFRYDSIHEIFNRVGIEGVSRRCVRDDKFIKALCETHNIDGEPDHKLLLALLNSNLDDLAQRRNEIAHGARIDDIESIELLVSRIHFVRAYCVSIHKVVSAHFNEYIFTTFKNIQLGMPAKAFNKLRVLGFTPSPAASPQHDIKVGDLIFVASPNNTGALVSGSVLSLRNGRSPVNTLSFPCGEDFTIGVDFEFNSNITHRIVYVVPAP